MTITTTLKSVGQSFPGFSQIGRVKHPDGRLSIGVPASPAIFTRTCMASITGDFLFEVGAGRLDPIEHTRLLMQFASDSGRSLVDVRDEYLGLLKTLGYQQDAFRRVVAGIIGSAERAQRVHAVVPVTPTYVFKMLTPALEGAPEVLVHMVTDYVCHMLRPLGWIIADAPFVYKIKRSGLFMRYEDAVNVAVAEDLRRTLQSLADADLSVVKNAQDKKGSLLPAMVAQHLANAVVVAYDLAQGVYDAESVARSVLTCVGYLHDPNLPVEMQLKERVRNHPAMAEFRSNLGLFLAYQDMVAKGVKPSITYSDEEMAAVVLPLFQRAIAEVSPFAVRILDDVVAHIGKKATRNHNGVPGHVIIFEDWSFSSQVTAFMKVRQSAKGNQAFLEPSPTTSASLTATMKPICEALDVRSLVDHRITTYELAAASQRVPSKGTTLVLAMPSLLETEIIEGLPLGTSSNLLAGNPLADGVEVTDGFKSRLIFDYYSMLAHLATVKASSVAVATVKTGAGNAPYMIWTQRTSLREPIGDSTIFSGEVVTTEPLESIAYAEDFTATSPREVKVLPLDDFKDGVHIWRWFEASIPLDLESSFPITVRNNAYLALVDEHELLGLGVKRRNLRFMRPVMATAVARVWLQWLLDDDKFIEQQLKSTKDTLVRESFRGRQLQNALQMASMLTRIGSSGAGSNAVAAIHSKIADQMFESGNIDDYAEIHVGIQRHRLHIWAGLVSMQLLGLIDVADATKVISYLADHEALSLVVGTIDLPLSGAR